MTLLFVQHGSDSSVRIFAAAALALLGLCAALRDGLAPDSPAGVPTAHAAPRGRILFGHLGDVWLAEDGRLSAVTQGDRYWGQPDWSPDGARLALVGWNPSSTDIFVLEGENLEMRQLTRNRQQRQEDSDWVFFPRWSPSGDVIAFLSDRTSTYTMLWTMRPDGSNARQLTYPRRGLDAVDSYTWSPDGNFIAAAGFAGSSSQVHVIELVRPSASRIVTNEPSGAFDPAWSPDGMHIAYAAREGRNTVIKLMNVSGANPPVTLVQTEVARSPRWSPSGTTLAYVALAGAAFELFTLDVSYDGDGNPIPGRPSQLTTSFGVDSTSGVSWAP